MLYVILGLWIISSLLGAPRTDGADEEVKVGHAEQHFGRNVRKHAALNELPSLSTSRWVSGFSANGLYWSTERLFQKPCGSLTVLWLQLKSKYLLAQRGSSCQTRSGPEAVKSGLLRRRHTVRSSCLLPFRIIVPVADGLGYTQTRRLVLEQRKSFFHWRQETAVKCGIDRF